MRPFTQDRAASQSSCLHNDALEEQGNELEKSGLGGGQSEIILKSFVTSASIRTPLMQHQTRQRE